MLVLIAGVTRVYREPLHELWFPDGGRPMVGTSMALRRFRDNLHYVRFDKGARVGRGNGNDTLATFKETVWS